MNKVMHMLLVVALSLIVLAGCEDAGAGGGDGGDSGGGSGGGSGTGLGSGVDSALGATASLSGEITVEVATNGTSSTYVHTSGRSFQLLLSNSGPGQTDTTDDAMLDLPLTTPGTLEDAATTFGTGVSSAPGTATFDAVIEILGSDSGTVQFGWYDETNDDFYNEAYVYASEDAIVTGTADGVAYNLTLEAGWNVVIARNSDPSTDGSPIDAGGITVPSGLDGAWFFLADADEPGDNDNVDFADADEPGNNDRVDDQIVGIVWEYTLFAGTPTPISQVGNFDEDSSSETITTRYYLLIEGGVGRVYSYQTLSDPGSDQSLSEIYPVYTHLTQHNFAYVTKPDSWTLSNNTISAVGGSEGNSTLVVATNVSKGTLQAVTQ